MKSQSFKAAWTAIDQAQDPAYFVRFMDIVQGGQRDDPKRFGMLLEALGVRAGDRILDLGCGTGSAARVLARRTESRVTGLDKSATMVSEARRRTAGDSRSVRFGVADAYCLPFADATFDGAYSLGLFELLADARRALAEMTRVTRPGGQILATGLDADTLAVDAPNRELTRRIVHFICDHEYHGWIGRQLPALCKQAGLENVRVRPLTFVTTDFAVLYQLWLCKTLERAREAGVVDAEEVAAWVDGLEKRHRQGQFYFSQTVVGVVARKP